MAISYNPKDANSKPWPDGTYDAEITKVDETTSKKSGAEMLKITFMVFSPSGQQKKVMSDYIVIPSALFKMKQLAAALGKKADFDAGTFQTEDYQGSGLKVVLVTEDNDNFGLQNKISKYVPAASDNQTAAKNQKPQSMRKPATAMAGSPISETQHIDPADIPF